MKGIIKFNDLTPYLRVVLTDEKKDDSGQKAEGQSPFPF
jgi:hypothetical protein